MAYPRPDRAEPTGAFTERVVAIVGATTPGELVTYGEVAAEAGRPQAARAVGQILAHHAELPWWRVISASGRLVPGNEARHRALLQAEGVACTGKFVARTHLSRPRT
ncbi:MAG: MGMT family protein [Nitriliruptoraceae bacterium]